MKKIHMERWPSRAAVLAGPDCPTVFFRTRKKLETYISALFSCRRCEKRFLELNSVLAESANWNRDKLIFTVPTIKGFYDSGYAKIYFAKFEQTLPDTKIASISDHNLDIFLSTFFPFVYNRFPTVLCRYPRQYLFFNSNLNRFYIFPGNSRHKFTREREISNKHSFLFPR